jgi:tetratricopeptide (TPR) repeat protein
VFIVFVGASLIYGLVDKRKVTTSSDKAYQAYLEGEDLRDRLYTGEALKQFEQAIKFDPYFAMAYYQAAVLYKSFDRRDDYEESRSKALGLFDRVKEKERIIISLGFARADDRRADVDRFSKELLDKYPESFEAHEYLGGRAFLQHDFDKAIEENLKILTKNPNHAVSYNILGYSYYYKGEYDKALENLDKYSSLAPDQANPHDSYGEILLNLGRYDEALVEFREADSIKSGLHFVVGHIADTYRAKGMYRDAIGAYFKARELSPNEETKADIDGDIALCYLESGKIGEATSVLKESVARKPDDLKANAILGGIYAETGEMEGALLQLGIVKGIIARYQNPLPTDEKVSISVKSAEYYLAGEVAFYRGEYQVALENLGKLYAENMPPDKVYFAGLLGEALTKAQMPDSAVAVLNAALEENPNSEICLRCLAGAYRELGQKDSERGALERYLAVMKDADEGLTRVISAAATLDQLSRKNL